jgi:hypothetical protein
MYKVCRNCKKHKQIDLFVKNLASFDLTDPVQFKQACHYTNLQPLWAEDHILKSSKERRIIS